MKLFCDNQSAISIAKNPLHHDRTNHVKIDRHFIKKKIEGTVIELAYNPTSSQVVDILTKALPRKCFKDLSSKLGMNNIFTLA